MLAGLIFMSAPLGAMDAVARLDAAIKQAQEDAKTAQDTQTLQAQTLQIGEQSSVLGAKSNGPRLKSLTKMRPKRPARKPSKFPAKSLQIVAAEKKETKEPGVGEVNNDDNNAPKVTKSSKRAWLAWTGLISATVGAYAAYAYLSAQDIPCYQLADDDFLMDEQTAEPACYQFFKWFPVDCATLEQPARGAFGLI